MKKDVLICDANHGGLTLLKKYHEYTKNKLYFYDTYNKLDDNEKREYEDRYNVKFLGLDEIDNSYISIAPVHMKKLFKIDYSHHEFTSYLVKKHQQKYGWNFKLIQVTGVKGKTSTANFTASLLEDYNILLLTSNNLSYISNKKSIILDDSLSITPASIIESIDIAKKHDLLDKIDYFIMEVSLGVIPDGFISILTNILEDYPIASGQSSASLAKESIFKSKYTLCDKKALDDYYSDKEALSVSISDDDAEFYLSDIEYDFFNTKFTFHHEGNIYDLESFAPSDFYLNNILFALGVASILDIGMDKIRPNLSKLNSVEGRFSYKKIDDMLIVEDVNPGLNTTSIKNSINNLNRYYENFIIILGGDYGITCEEIDEKKLLNYLETISNKNVILTGKVGFSLYQKLENKFPYVEKLNDALTYSIENYEEKVVEVIYRSEYGKNPIK